MSRLSKIAATAGITFAALTGMGAGSAKAAVTTYTLELPINFAFAGGNNGDLTGWDFTATIPQFSRSMAGINADCLSGAVCVLTGVSTTVQVQSGGYVNFTAPNNNSGSLINFGIGSSIGFTNQLTGAFVEPSATSLICNSAVVSLSNGVSCLTGARIPLAANKAFRATMLTSASATDTISSTDPTVLAEISSDVFNLITDGFTSSATSGTDNNNVATDPQVTAFVSGYVDYTYANIPEPGTVAITAAALLGLGVARRRQGRS